MSFISSLTLLICSVISSTSCLTLLLAVSIMSCSRAICISALSDDPVRSLSILFAKLVMLFSSRKICTFTRSILATVSAAGVACSMCALDRNPNIPNDVINIKTNTAIVR